MLPARPLVSPKTWLVREEAEDLVKAVRQWVIGMSGGAYVQARQPALSPQNSQVTGQSGQPGPLYLSVCISLCILFITTTI